MRAAPRERPSLLNNPLIAEWGSGDDSFIKNPPNATVSVLGKDGTVKDAVVVRTWTMNGFRLIKARISPKRYIWSWEPTDFRSKKGAGYPNDRIECS